MRVILCLSSYTPREKLPEDLDAENVARFRTEEDGVPNHSRDKLLVA